MMGKFFENLKPSDLDTDRGMGRLSTDWKREEQNKDTNNELVKRSRSCVLTKLPN